MTPKMNLAWHFVGNTLRDGRPVPPERVQMNRRSFMSNILALGAAPAIVRADALMRIVPRETTLILQPWQEELLCVFHSDDLIITGSIQECHTRIFKRRMT